MRVTTADGAEIAYSVTGSGRPLVYVSGWLSHLERALPEEQRFLGDLGRGARLMRYDRDGCGLSAPASRPPSLAHELDQLTSVVATLGDQPVDLVGTSLGALVAAAWAAEHPARVRRLVLYGGWVDGAEISAPTARDHLLGLVEAHWGLGSDVLTEIFAPDAGAATRAAVARYQRDSSTAETARDLLALSYAIDIGAYLPRITVPTLVLHREGDRAAPLAQARELAAGISGARLEVLPGRSHLPYIGDAQAVVSAIRRFLGLRVTRTADLTQRQFEVAALVAAGRTNREIAETLGIEERSAEGHVERIRTRLGVGSRAQIAAWYAARN